MTEYERTLEDVVKSFLEELDWKGEITDNIIQDTLPIIVMECKKHIRPFIVHVVGYEWYWWMEYWWQDYLKYKVNCEIGARGLGKSCFWSELIAAYNDFISHRFESMMVGYNQDAGNENIRKVKDHFEINEFLNTRVPKGKGNTWSTLDLHFEGKSRSRSKGMNSQLRGGHPNYICADDIKNDQQTLTDQELKVRLVGTLLPMVNRKVPAKLKRSKIKKFALVGTLFSQVDIYHYVEEIAKERAGWNFRKVWIELDHERKVIVICTHEEKRDDEYGIYDYEELADLYYADPDYFMREYGCKIMSSETSLVNYEKHIAPAKDVTVTLEDRGEPGQRYVFISDIARAKDGDYTVILGLKFIIKQEDTKEGKKRDVNAQICYYDRFKGVETEAQTDEMRRVSELFNHPDYWVENNNMGITLVDSMRRKNLRVTEFNTNKYSRPEIMRNLQTWFFNHKVIIPSKTHRDQKKMTNIITEVLSFQRTVDKKGNIVIKSVGKHDDSAMSLAIGLHAVQESIGKKLRMRGKSYDRSKRKRKRRGAEHIPMF